MNLEDIFQDAMAKEFCDEQNVKKNRKMGKQKKKIVLKNLCDENICNKNFWDETHKLKF